MIRSLATLLVVLAASVHVIGSEGRTMDLQEVEYLVGDLPEHPQRLTVAHGRMRYESHSNQGRPALGMGVYERSYSDTDMATIASQIDPGSFESLPDHAGKVLSGEGWKRIRLTVNGKTCDKLVGFRLPIDPRLKRTLDLLDRLVDTAVQHPRSVLQIRLTDAVRTDAGDFSATLTLGAVGDGHKLGFGAAQNQPERSLTLYWWPHRAGAPKADVQSIRTLSVAPAPATGPEALVSFRIRTRVDGALPEPLAVQVQYANVGATADAEGAWPGLLFSEPVVVR